MKVKVSRASSRADEYETDLDISEKLVSQLLSLGEVIPIAEGTESWDNPEEKSKNLIIDINPDTGQVELMIYDYYIEL